MKPHNSTENIADGSSVANWPRRLILLLKGMAMGVADSVPGVSGGTVAVICGIYEELIHSIKSINPMNLPLLWRDGVPAFWRVINGNFLAILLVGIVSSLLLAANTVLYLLDNHFVLVMAFFIGLIMASSWFLQKLVDKWDLLAIACFLVGAAISLLAAFVTPVQGSFSLWYIFFCGLIAICAMILPGLSGAFILILLGVYNYVLDALRSFQFDVILVFVCGCIIGLLSFSHVLAWTFHYYYRQTYAFLTGMLVASIAVLWPWKNQIAAPVSVPGAEPVMFSVNVSPAEYEAVTGQGAQILPVLLLMLAGFTLIAVFEFAVRPRIENDEQN